MQILHYADDLLISGEREEPVRRATGLLNFLGKKGLRVLKGKLQFVDKEVTYLGHIIGSRYKRLSLDRIQGIISLPAPKTKRDIRKLLGLTGYCKLWIGEYTKLVKFLYDKLGESEPFNWSDEDEKQITNLKEELIRVPVLSLPNLKKPFDMR